MKNRLLTLLDPVHFAHEFLDFRPDASQEALLRSTSRRLAVNCTRQWGKSTVTAVKAVHCAYVYPESLILVVSPSARQSAEFLRKSARFIRKLNYRIRGDGDNEISILFPNGSRIVGLPSTEDRIRGFSSVSLLVIDEASRVEDKIYNAVRPMLAVGGADGHGGAMWLMSTPNGKRGFFWDVWSRGGAEWERLRVPATHCPRISPHFLDEERRSNSARFFEQEYMCEFSDREDGAFREDWITQSISPNVPILGQPNPREPGAVIDENSRRFFVGLDLGQRQDHTAIAVVERHCFVNVDRDPGTRDQNFAYRYHVRYLRRLPLGVGYTEVVEIIRSLMQSKEIAGRCTLVVDSSGVGAPVVELLRKCSGCPVDPVTITAGQNLRLDQWGYKMPRRELMSHIALMLEQRQLVIASEIPELENLRNELRNMRLSYTGKGQEQYDPERDSVHDDLVIAISLAAWKAKRSAGHVFGTQRLF